METSHPTNPTLPPLPFLGTLPSPPEWSSEALGAGRGTVCPTGRDTAADGPRQTSCSHQPRLSSFKGNMEHSGITAKAFQQIRTLEEKLPR